MKLGQLECPFDVSLAEDLSSYVEEEALSSCWYEKEPENWTFQAIYEFPQETSIMAKVSSFFKQRGHSIPTLTAGLLPEEDWVAAVYRDFSPLTIGQFYIYGSHIQDPLPQDLFPLCIDAATAFGSGQHESTEGCLKALTFLAKEQPFCHPLDMGCGSGILALGMASLWRVPVLACDNDPEAVRVTQENAKMNHLDAFVQAQVSEGFSAINNRTFDIITANILAGPLCQMASRMIQALVPAGYVVLAGLLNRQAEDVIDSYRSVGAKLVDQLFIGDWSTLILRKGNHG